ncbi:MAG TPA: DUF5025 domain-containing protein [Prolixibacteraceae bacterium]|nr:DUF5025 domain-containing protein [Prolixibacteraceae bacterium]
MICKTLSLFLQKYGRYIKGLDVIKRDNYLPIKNIGLIIIYYLKFDDMSKYLKINLLGLGMLIFILGCTKKEELKQDPNPLNSFSMTINDQLWQPSIIGTDSCSVAYCCESSAVDQIPFYKITAYKDPIYRTDGDSENIFFLQVMGVYGKGVYPISDSFGDFKSYARFVINEPGNHKIYDNSTTKETSIVRIDEMIPLEGFSFIGIRGTFTGVLFNVDNANDSIVIDNLKFTFKKINRRNYYQCPE